MYIRSPNNSHEEAEVESNGLTRQDHANPITQRASNSSMAPRLVRRSSFDHPPLSLSSHSQATQSWQTVQKDDIPMGQVEPVRTAQGLRFDAFATSPRGVAIGAFDRYSVDPQCLTGQFQVRALGESLSFSGRSWNPKYNPMG